MSFSKFLGLIVYYIFSYITAFISSPVEYNMLLGLSIIFVPLWIYITYKLLFSKKDQKDFVVAVLMGPIIFTTTIIMMVWS
jgi:hypothetical protein